MKTITKILLLVIFVLSISSCKNTSTKMLTVINTDGSCEKTFQFDADSAFMAGQPEAVEKAFPVPVDASWKISWKTDYTESRTDFPIKNAVYDSILGLAPLKKDSITGISTRENPVFHIEIRRHFASVEELEKSFRLKKSNPWSELKVKYRFEKKFRWFYTYFTYKEEYPALQTGFPVPASRYMTKEETSYWFKGTPNLTEGMNGVEAREFTGDLEDKFNKWFNYNFWKMEYTEMLKHYKTLNNKPVIPEKMAGLCDSIFDAATIQSFNIEMGKVLNKFFSTTAFSALWNGADSPMKVYEKKQGDNFHFFFESLNYRLQMPGTALPSEGARLDKNILQWNLTAFRLMDGPYSVEAHSRKANTWAFVLTGLMVLLALGSFFYRPGKKK